MAKAERQVYSGLLTYGMLASQRTAPNSFYGPVVNLDANGLDDGQKTQANTGATIRETGFRQKFAEQAVRGTYARWQQQELSQAPYRMIEADASDEHGCTQGKKPRPRGSLRVAPRHCAA
jgi:hypothetical protein